MKASRFVIALAVTAGLAFFAGRGFTEDEAEDPMGEMGKLMREMATPGPQHAELAKMAGTWDIDGKFWMQPGAEPTTSKGTAKIAMILGGRFQTHDYTGEMMGEEFSGFGVTGFDNHKKQYWNMWCDTMATNYMFSTGPEQGDGKVVEMKGLWESPMGDMHSRQILTFVSDDEYRMEMFMSMGEMGEMKSMELVYKRRK